MRDYSLSPREEALDAKIAAFIRDVVIPYESDPRIDAHGPSDALRVEMQAKAKAAGVFTPHLPEKWGGLGLTHQEQAVAFRAAG